MQFLLQLVGWCDSGHGVRNAGPGTATGVTVSLELARGLSGLKVTGTRPGGNRVVWRHVELAPGTSRSYTAIVRAGPTITGTKSISLTATATADRHTADNRAHRNIRIEQ